MPCCTGRSIVTRKDPDYIVGHYDCWLTLTVPPDTRLGVTVTLLFDCDRPRLYYDCPGKRIDPIATLVVPITIPHVVVVGNPPALFNPVDYRY